MGDMLRRTRKWIILDALALLCLSGYELLSRLDAIQGPLKMFVNMAIGEKIPLERVITYVDVSVFTVPVFMLLCVLTALLALWVRTSRRGCFFLLPISLALTVWGTFIQLSLLGELIRFVKVLPLLLLTVLSTMVLIAQSLQRRRLRSRALKIGQSAGYAPTPTFMQERPQEGRRFQYGIEDHPRRSPKRRRVS